MKKLTVAISCYNFENYIEECVRSILKQKTNFDFDIVIRDDLSKDRSREIIRELAEKNSHIRNIKYIFGEHNLGVNRNVQNLLENCEGQYIALIDGDDFYSDEFKLQKQVDFLDENQSYVMHSTSYRYMHKNGVPEPLDPNFWYCGVKDTVSIEDLLERNIISFGRVFRNLKEPFKNLINKDYYIGIPYDDWALNFEILKYGYCKCEDFPSGFYRITGNGVITGNSDDEIKRKNEICRKLLKEEYNLYKNQKA